MTRMVDKGELDGNKSLIGRERGGRREREEGLGMGSPGVGGAGSGTGGVQ